MEEGVRGGTWHLPAPCGSLPDHAWTRSCACAGPRGHLAPGVSQVQCLRPWRAALALSSFPLSSFAHFKTDPRSRHRTRRSRVALAPPPGRAGEVGDPGPWTPVPLPQGASCWLGLEWPLQEPHLGSDGHTSYMVTRGPAGCPF